MFNTLNLETLQLKAPSVFSEKSSARTSKKYQHISTIKVVERLIKEGFMPTFARQSGCRLADKRNHTKHVIRFRHENAQPTASGLFPELVLVNSHDGLSSYRLMAGLYRLVCSNGLVAGNDYEEIRVRHQGDIIGDVIDGTYEIIDTSHKMLTSANQMEKIELNDSAKISFAESAHRIRFKDNEELGKAIDPKRLLTPRRSADRANDLFTIFNVIQENVIKGGIRGYGIDSHRYIKRVSTREVKSIDQSTALNRALWTLAEQMIKLKTA